MKSKILQTIESIILIMALCSSAKSQIPEDYPFKTYLDTEDNLYITGYDDNYDIETIRFPSVGYYYDWKKSYPNPGFDRGMDLVLDANRNVYVCGNLQSENGFTDLCILRHNEFDGDISMVKKLNFPKEDKFFGIAREGDYFYAAGYKTSRNLKDFFLMKFDRFGDTIWTRTFNNSDYNRDDVATDILVDGNFVYAIGYTYNGEGFKNDIILYTCDHNGGNVNTQIVNRKFTNETPTAFIFAKIIDAPPLQKSRTAVVVVTDLPFGQGGNNFLTYYFKDNTTTSLHWIRDFSGGGSSVSIPTAIAADPIGNVYVTGYTNMNAGNGYDFVSMKYNKDSGSYGWNSPSVIFYDSLNGNDKASSIKVKNNRIYIAGSSDSTQNGYYVAAYNQVQGYPHKDFDNVFVPSFSRNGAVNQNVKRAAVIELDSSGNTYLIAQSWNETQAYYAIRKYDQQGNVIHTIDPYEHLFGGSESDNTTSQLQTTEEITLLGNYPNPFNPVTNIRYDLQQDNFVTIRVYDVLGKEVVTLVNENKKAGKYLISFNGTGLSSGIYLYKIKAGEYEHTRRMTLLK
jgi:hypothetical protein